MAGLSWIAGALALFTMCEILAAPWLYAAGRRAAACGTNGAALACVATGSVLALALNPDPRLSAPGVAALGAVLALAAFSLHAARTGRRLAAAFWLGWLANLTLAAGLVYLLVGFRIF